MRSETLEIDPLIAYIRERYREDDKKIQVLGFEIPQSSISQWGIAVLIACEIYLLLHLCRSRSLWIADDLPRDPWIALYQDWFSCTVSLSSITALPLSAAILLAWNGWTADSYPATRATVMGALVVSAGLCALLWFNWPTKMRQYSSAMA